MSKIVPGQRTPFIFEIPPIRCPQWRNILRQTYLESEVVLEGSRAAVRSGHPIDCSFSKRSIFCRLSSLEQSLMIGLLQLPRDAATVFFLGFLRRYYGAAGLYDMAQQGQGTLSRSSSASP